MILFGSVYYTWVKHQESHPTKDYERVPLEDVEAGLRKTPEVKPE